MTVKTFVSPGGGKRVGVIIENVPSVEALTEALQSPEAAAAMKSSTVSGCTPSCHDPPVRLKEVPLPIRTGRVDKDPLHKIIVFFHMPSL